MRISDWSSDVCSSDLVEFVGPGVIGADELFRAARRAIDEARAAMAADVGEGAHDAVGAAHEDHAFAGIVDAVPVTGVRDVAVVADDLPARAEDARSEEHTSELPSLMRISYAVF